MFIASIIGIVIGLLFVLAGIFKWGPLVVRNGQGQAGVVQPSAGGYTAIMIIIGLVVIGSSIAGIVTHHP